MEMRRAMMFGDVDVYLDAEIAVVRTHRRFAPAAVSCSVALPSPTSTRHDDDSPASPVVPIPRVPHPPKGAGSGSLPPKRFSAADHATGDLVWDRSTAVPVRYSHGAVAAVKPQAATKSAMKKTTAIDDDTVMSPLAPTTTSPKKAKKTVSLLVKQ